MKSRIFLVFFVLLLGFLAVNQAAYAAITLYLNDVEVDMPAAPRIIAGRVTVPVDFLGDRLGYAFGWSTETTFWLDTGTDVYTGKIGSWSLDGSQREINLGAPAEVHDGYLYLPLPVLADLLGLQLSWDTANRALRLTGVVRQVFAVHSTESDIPSDEVPVGALGAALGKPYTHTASDASTESKSDGGETVVDPSLARIRAIALVRENTRQSLEVVADRDIELNISLLQEPPRLVIDISKAVMPPAENLNFSPQGLIKNLRLSQFQPDVVRIVVDLGRITGYQVEQLSNNRFAVHLNEVVAGINIVREGGAVIVSIRTTGEVQPETLLLREPNRLVVDLHGTTLIMPATSASLSDPLLRGVRVSQFQPHIVRTVLELEKLLTPEQVTVVSSKDGTEILLADEVSEEVNSVSHTLWTYTDPELTFEVFQAEQEGTSFDEPTESHAEMASIGIEDLAKTLSPQTVRGMTVEEVGAQLKYVKNKVIVIDPGHGGIEVGAAGRQGVWEKDLNLDVALAVERGLRRAGADVHMTRSADVLVSLHDRAECANAKKADAFISIHFNASYFKQAKGTETLFRHNHVFSQLLAASLQRMLVDVLETVDRGIKVREDLYILRHSQVPTALVEVGFLDHEEEGVRFLEPAEREKAAVGILLGIDRFFARMEAGGMSSAADMDAEADTQLEQAEVNGQVGNGPAHGNGREASTVEEQEGP